MKMIKIANRRCGYDRARIFVDLDKKMVLAAGRECLFFDGPLVIVNVVLTDDMANEIVSWNQTPKRYRKKSHNLRGLIATAYQKAADRDGWFEKFIK